MPTPWSRMCRSATLGLTLLLAGGMLGWPGAVEAARLARVTAGFEAVPDQVELGRDVDLIVRLTAHGEAPSVVVDVASSTDYQVLGTPVLWTGALAADQSLDLPIRVRFLAGGEYTLGVRVTTELAGGRRESAGAALPVSAGGGVARLGGDVHVEAVLRESAGVPGAMSLVSVPPAEGPPPDLPEGRAGADATVGTYRGQILYTDPEGHTHPVRGARVEVYDGPPGGTLLAVTLTWLDGRFAATVVSASGQVGLRVLTRDFTGGTMVVVHPDGFPAASWGFESGPFALGGGLNHLFVLPAPVRGTPIHPGVDTPLQLASRAFAVFDLLLSYHFQSGALTGRTLPAAVAAFPRTDGSQVSSYSKTEGRLRIHRGDTYDGDVVGHEFFHFVTHVASARVINTNPGGPHHGGSTIGLNGRTRDQALRLAWAEGVATFMSVALQNRPLPVLVGFPVGLLNVGDRRYTETENQQFSEDLESMPSAEGFASEDSVIGALWDLLDGDQDAGGGVVDTFAGATPKILWNAIAGFLPCDPCDRVDRFWSGLVRLLGDFNPALLSMARPFVLAHIAPRAVSPANGTSLGGGLRPTFTWVANGDPSVQQRNNRFQLVFSRDGFRSHLVPLYPPLGQTSYTPTEEEWNRVLAGGASGATYQWLVRALSMGNPVVPELGTAWYSNVLSFRVRSLHVRIRWDKLGADVDLHLDSPYGNVSYANRSTGWASLDRDCTTTCTEENISLEGLPGNGGYDLYARYYSSHGRGPTTVHAEVFNGGSLAFERTFVLGRTGDEYSFLAWIVQEGQVTDLVEVPRTSAAPRHLPPPKPASGP